MCSVDDKLGEREGREYYINLRRRFEPRKIKLAIIAESPPASGRYFYDEAGKSSEPLFTALMHYVGLEGRPNQKTDGLRLLQNKGWILVDATYQPVNKIPDKEADKLIVNSYTDLCLDLESLGRPPVILIKKNVCKILEPKLTKDGFKVLNSGRIVYFPSHSRQTDFHRQFSAILNRLETLGDSNS